MGRPQSNGPRHNNAGYPQPQTRGAVQPTIAANSSRVMPAPPVKWPSPTQIAQPKPEGHAPRNRQAVPVPQLRMLQATGTAQRRSGAQRTTAKACAPLPPVRILATSNGPRTSSLSVQLYNTNGSAVVQRYCGAPGCTDPDCHDVANHGFEKIYPLRGRTVYHGNIDAGDIGTGTGTNKTTRTYVNSIQYPEQVSIEYNPGGHYGTGGRSEFVNQPLGPGQRADAGHIFGNQYGGYGNQSAAVFPQHPQTNRGNSYNGAPTRDLWRAHEDNVRHLAQQGFTVGNSVTIRDERRVPYYCPACNKPLNGSTTCKHCRWTM